MSASANDTRYVDDVPYVHAFIPELSPAWLDFTALLWGIAPPDREAGFSWCDLGCGQGVNAVVFAATHPKGQFHGVDAMASHAENGRRLARAVGASNVRFHAADFGAAADLDLPGFDYITAHGVYSWVDDQARADLLRFVDRRLKPGGRLYVSYNALPGRAPDLPFQRIMLEVARHCEGDSGARVRQAGAFVSQLKAIGAPAITASPMAQLLLTAKFQRNGAYLAHELLGSNWRPLNVTEVRADMARIGLTPAGSAVLMDNFDDFVLGKAARRVLARVADPDLRALVRDYLTNQSFRRDVFVRDGVPLGEPERRRRILETAFATPHPKSRARYSLQSPAGEVGFDNPVARQMVAALAKGPRRLGDLVGPKADVEDVLANAMVLASAHQIWPVDPGVANVSSLNKLVLERLGGSDELRLAALACGTAIPVPARLLADLRDGRTSSKGANSTWRAHLAAYGAHGLDVLG
jgi:SAM-dependent methyltransferase